MSNNERDFKELFDELKKEFPDVPDEDIVEWIDDLYKAIEEAGRKS